MLIKDQWLSKVTGINCFNVKKKNFLFKHNRKGPTLITYKAEKKNKNKINPNFVKIGENIIFKKEIKKNLNYKGENLLLVPSIKSEKKKLIEICLKNMKSSRFDLDRRIPKHIVKRIRKKWISSYFLKLKNKEIFSIYKKKTLVGLLCVIKRKNNLIIDLIAVSKNQIGKNIGKSIIENLQIRFPKFKNIIVGTYNINKRAMNFYRNNKFKKVRSYMVYHFYER